MTLDCMSSAETSSFPVLNAVVPQKREPIEAEKERGGGESQGRSQSVRLGLFLFTVKPLILSYSPQVASSLFLAHNTALVPPYRVLIDTNFINFSLQNKLELVSGMMDCLYAKCMH